MQALSIINTDELCDKLYARIDSRLSAIAKQPVPDSLDEPLSLEKCAQIDGRSVFTWYGVTHRKEIPFFKKGRKVYILRRDLMEYMRTPNPPKISKEKKEYAHNELPH